MKWAHEQALPDSESKLLLLILANYAGHDNSCWPSVKRLARECVFSESKAHRRLKQLERLGFIKILPRNDERGDPTSNLYQLLTGPGVSLTPPPCQTDTTPGVPLTPKPISINQSMNRGRPRSILDIKDIIDAKREVSERLKRKSSETANGRKWESEDDRIRFIKLRNEINHLNDEIADMK